jgi:hypothetical protein
MVARHAVCLPFLEWTCSRFYFLSFFIAGLACWVCGEESALRFSRRGSPVVIVQRRGRPRVGVGVTRPPSERVW